MADAAEDEKVAREYDFYLARSYLQFMVPLWALAIVLRLASAPGSDDVWNTLTSAIEVPSLYVLLAMAVGWCLRSYHSAMRLSALFLQIVVAVSAFRLFAGLLDLPIPPEFFEVFAGISCAGRGMLHLVDVNGFIKDRGLVIGGGLLLLAGCVSMAFADDIRLRLHTKVFSFANPEAEPQSGIWDMPADRLWEAQPDLVDNMARLRPVDETAGGRVYLAALAPDGTQALFEREARHALNAFAARLDGRVRMHVLLSNRGEAIEEVPLATNGNLDRVADLIREDADRDSDMIVLYLTSHGSEEAWLTTVLADYTRIEPFRAERLAQTLDRAGVKRRIILVSACYSGSWIEPLKTEHSIILTASREDRTSFGCSDDREMTYFAEHFFSGDRLARQSLKSVFENARAEITEGENAMGISPSEPQVHVGKNMRDVWTTPPL